MIDLHNHMLPGIDDGARTTSDMLDLVEQAVGAGITHMMFTPHIHLGVFNNSKVGIQNVFSDNIQFLKQKFPETRFSFSAEIRIDTNIIDLVKKNAIPYLGKYQGKNLILLELPHSHIPAGTDVLIKWLLKNNVQPVIPHPERNRDILQNYDKVLWLKKLGCLFQLTAGSLTSQFSNAVKRTAWQMIDDRLISYIASDTHNTDKRSNKMLDAYNILSSSFSEEYARELCVLTPQNLTKEVQWL